MSSLDLKVHHIGWAVPSIGRSTEVFRALGYDLEPSLPDTVDDHFGVRLRFLRRTGDPVLIELVEPTTAKSSVQGVLGRAGAGPYHLGYCVQDLRAEQARLVALGFRAVTSPHPAPALGLRAVQFFHRQDFGLVELIESPDE